MVSRSTHSISYLVRFLGGFLILFPGPQSQEQQQPDRQAQCQQGPAHHRLPGQGAGAGGGRNGEGHGMGGQANAPFETDLFRGAADDPGRVDLGSMRAVCRRGNALAHHSGRQSGLLARPHRPWSDSVRPGEDRRSGPPFKNGR